MIPRQANLRTALGQILRQARERHGLSLRGVTELSGGRFKPSSVGDYERGARGISLERFCELATLYGLPADRLLGEALSSLDPPGRESVVVDLTRLSHLDEPPRRLVAEFLHAMKDRRGDLVTDVITLRSGDVEEMALSARVSVRKLLIGLRATVKEP